LYGGRWPDTVEYGEEAVVVGKEKAQIV